MFTTRARIDISLDDLLHNLRQIRSRISADIPVMAIVKDCAYGCGARPVARLLEREGVGFFGVARMSEAADLREAQITSPILCLGTCSGEEMKWAAENGVRVSVNDMSSLHDISRFSLPHTVHIHVNVDTGMGRLGITPGQVPDAAKLLSQLHGRVEPEGVFTHFACADEPYTKTVETQNLLFEKALNSFSDAGISFRYIHSPNSAAALRFDIPANHLIRPGIALYGCKPDPQQNFGTDLRPIASLKSEVVMVKRVAGGTPISYGAHYHAPRETTIATVALGYAHGFPRLLSNRGNVLIHGKRYPVAGNVTMDYIMVDIGDDAVEIGDEVVAWGRQNDAMISPDEVANMCSTIGYEILCGMSTSVPRHYWLDGSIRETVPPHLL
ncbi:MAG: alanine racemase [Chitinispirillaceae bacterium]